MAISDPGRGLVRCLGITAAALFAFTAASQQRAEALSLASPGAAPSAKFAADGLATEVRHGGGGGGGGFRGGGGGGGFRGGGVVAFTAVASAAAGFMAVDSGAAALRSMAADSEAVALQSIAAAFAPRRSFVAAACATDIATSITGRISITGITSTGGFTRRAITATRIIMATGTATAA